MLCYIEPAKDLCSKLHDMEKSKVKKNNDWTDEFDWQTTWDWRGKGYVQVCYTFIDSYDLYDIILSIIFGFRWRSSLWKLLWQELFVYTGVFLMISMVYRYFLTEEQQIEVEKLIRWCRQQSTGTANIIQIHLYIL